MKREAGSMVQIIFKTGSRVLEKMELPRQGGAAGEEPCQALLKFQGGNEAAEAPSGSGSRGG